MSVRTTKYLMRLILRSISEEGTVETRIRAPALTIACTSALRGISVVNNTSVLTAVHHGVCMLAIGIEHCRS
jgi:hypothetical protein